MLPLAIIDPLLPRGQPPTFRRRTSTSYHVVFATAKNGLPSNAKFAEPFYEIRHVGGPIRLELQDLPGPRMRESDEARMQRLASKRPDPVP
jgi:hypothetical protein